MNVLSSCSCFPSRQKHEDLPDGMYRPSLHDFSLDIQEELIQVRRKFLHNEKSWKSDEHKGNVRLVMYK